MKQLEEKGWKKVKKAEREEKKGKEGKKIHLKTKVRHHFPAVS